MFKPIYNISNKLLANIKRISLIVSGLNNRRFQEIVLHELEKKAREISSYASTSIEGNPLPLTDVKRIIKNQPKNLRDSEREVINYNNLLKELNNAIKNRSFKLDLSQILDIHSKIVDGLLPKYQTGKLRKEPVFVNDPRTGKTIFWPPDHKDVPGLMSDLLGFVNKNEGIVDPLIIAGIFHKQFVVIHPFMDGNGRTARVCTKTLLADMGINTFNLFSFENYYNKNVTRYFKNIGLLGDYYDHADKLDFTGWLEYFTDGIIDDLLRVEKILLNTAKEPSGRLYPYHEKILKIIEERGFISDKDYSEVAERAKATRSLDFKKLIELGYIERKGRGKATYYVLKDN